MNPNEKLLFKTKKTPIPSKPGIILSGPVDGICPIDNDIWMHGALALGESELGMMPAESWVRCLIISGVSLTNQFSYLESMVEDRVVFPEEIHEENLANGTKLNVVAFNFELAKALRFPPHQETLFIQAICLTFRSEMLEIHFK
jgi:hypothetical protein